VAFDDFGQPTGRIAVLINNGSGQFAAPKIVTVQGDPSLPIFGDLNNDGNLDLVVALFTVLLSAVNSLLTEIFQNLRSARVRWLCFRFQGRWSFILAVTPLWNDRVLRLRRSWLIRHTNLLPVRPAL
jgi:hypothetical protein